jgi:hypothetical protein
VSYTILTHQLTWSAIYYSARCFYYCMNTTLVITNETHIYITVYVEFLKFYPWFSKWFLLSGQYYKWPHPFSPWTTNGTHIYYLDFISIFEPYLEVVPHIYPQKRFLTLHGDNTAHFLVPPTLFRHWLLPCGMS